MLLHAVLTTLPILAPASTDVSPLAAVPADAFALVHCRDFAGLRSRAERNDWFRLAESPQGPFLQELSALYHEGTQSELDPLLGLANELTGECALYVSESTAAFVAAPPADRSSLARAMREWLPAGDATASRTLEIAGGSVELVAWPDDYVGWSGRTGRFAAFVDHPLAMGLFSADSADTLMAAVADAIAGLESSRRSPLVEAYSASGGGTGGGVELYVDFTPILPRIRARSAAELAEDLLFDPIGLLGLEAGTSLHVSADVFAGTRIDCTARVTLPANSLASRLADTFLPLAHDLPSDLPRGIWHLFAIRWDVKDFYRIARAAYTEVVGEEGLALLDSGIEAAKGMTGVDPVAEVLNQLEGTFALYAVDREAQPDDREWSYLLAYGVFAKLIDGAAFLSAFERLTETGGLDSVMDLDEIEGVDAYLIPDEEDFDGGLAFLPNAFMGTASRSVLERGLRALLRRPDASLVDGSRMQAAIDENLGACYLSVVELQAFRTHARRYGLDVDLPALDGDQAQARDPFDSQLVGSARRTKTGFDFRLYTR